MFAIIFITSVLQRKSLEQSFQSTSDGAAFRQPRQCRSPTPRIHPSSAQRRILVYKPSNRQLLLSYLVSNFMSTLIITSAIMGSQSSNGSSPSLSNPPLPTIRSKSPRKGHTDPEGGVKTEMFKRIVIFCDGTWRDGLSASQAKYTNVLRLARSVAQEDNRLEPPVAQIVFYQPGIGTDDNLFSRYVSGITGDTLGDKVEQTYAFIAHNYDPGDEIFLFGFSRGAYTARMVAQFIGEIGVLDRRDMDSFAEIFIDYQNLGKTKDASQKKAIEEKLAPWRSPEARGKKRVTTPDSEFKVKFLGVWDTVGALGLPGPFREQYKIFGFNDSLLGDHIDRACQALALNETRLDFTANKLQQTESGRAKNQYLKQVWFAGCHSDIGGGYSRHDLSDLTLFWMANEVETFLSLDLVYLQSQLRPVAPWGKQCPHDPTKRIFVLAMGLKRMLPSQPNDPITHECIHESVLEQPNCHPDIQTLVKTYPELICRLGHLEEAIKKNWPYDHSDGEAQQYDRDVLSQTGLDWIRDVVRTVVNPRRQDIAAMEASISTTQVTVDEANLGQSTTRVTEQVVLESSK